MASRIGRAVNRALKNSDNADAPSAEKSAAAMLDTKRQAPGQTDRMRDNSDAHQYDLTNRRRIRMSSRTVA